MHSLVLVALTDKSGNLARVLNRNVNYLYKYSHIKPQNYPWHQIEPCQWQTKNVLHAHLMIGTKWQNFPSSAVSVPHWHLVPTATLSWPGHAMRSKHLLSWLQFLWTLQFVMSSYYFHQEKNETLDAGQFQKRCQMRVERLLAANTIVVTFHVIIGFYRSIISE